MANKKSEPAMAEPSVQPVQAEEAASANKLDKASPKAKANPENKAQKHPPPPKKAFLGWNDVNYQMNKLEKAGKPELPQAWKKAQAGGQQTRREFYYQVFLLDPTVAKKEIHKESLERLKVQNTLTKGWFTKWDIGKMEGADPSLPMFEDLCTAAVEGLK